MLENITALLIYFNNSNMSPREEVRKESKFTRGEKCLFIHLIVTFALILVLVLVYFGHLLRVPHGAGDALRVTRRSRQHSGTCPAGGTPTYVFVTHRLSSPESKYLRCDQENCELARRFRLSIHRPFKLLTCGKTHRARTRCCNSPVFLF